MTVEELVMGLREHRDIIAIEVKRGPFSKVCKLKHIIHAVQDKGITLIAKPGKLRGPWKKAGTSHTDPAAFVAY